MAKKQKCAKRKPASPIEKILKNLIKLTTVPREKSAIQWKMDKVFSMYHFETEYKGKVYTFDGRHFFIYPAGYELPPGIRIGDKEGPDILLHARIDAAPKQFADLWQVVCGQHEKELQENERKERESLKASERRQKAERELSSRLAKDILKDFK